MTKVKTPLFYTLGFISLFAGNAFAYPDWGDGQATFQPQTSVFTGWYGGFNLGYGLFKMNLRRPPVDGLLQLNHSNITTNAWSYIPVIGYDFKKIFNAPLRIEGSFSYSSNSFLMNPVFIPPDFSTIINSKYKVYNAMASVYYDFYNATNFTPYFGISLGRDEIKTKNYHTTLTPAQQPLSDGKTNNVSWGAAFGGRFQFVQWNNVFIDLQVRYDSLGTINFYNHTPTLVPPLPGGVSYLANNLRQLTGSLGLIYEIS